MRGATPVPNCALLLNEHAHTGRKPTAKSSDSTAPSPTAGPMHDSTNQPNNAMPPCRAGCISTITVSLQVAGLGLAGRVSGGRLALGCDSYNHSPRWVRFGG